MGDVVPPRPRHLVDLAGEDARRPRPGVDDLLDLQDAADVAPPHGADADGHRTVRLVGQTGPLRQDLHRADSRVAQLISRVRMAQVQRLDLRRLDPFLPQRLGVRELHQRRRAGMGQPLLGELHAAGTGTDPVPVAQGAVADEQRVLAGGQQVGHQVVHRTDRRAFDPLHPAGDLPVRRVVHLAAAGVDHRADEPVGVAQRQGQQVEARHRDHRHAQRMGHRLGRGDAHPHAGEEPGAGIDGDGADLVQCDVGLPAQELDGGGQQLGVAAPAGHLEQAEHAFVPTDGTAHLLGGRLDSEEST